jgi:3-hydroxyisobutyrate dehydrogenase-like beta-hydroxyacid dehydrogenase
LIEKGYRVRRRVSPHVRAEQGFTIIEIGRGAEAHLERAEPVLNAVGAKVVAIVPV